MSDLAATNCGCGCENGCGGSRSGCDWILWILILSCICGNGNGILGGGCGDCGNNGCFGGDNCCWLIILILLFCGGFRNGNGDCGCGCNSGSCGCNNGCGC